MPVVNYLWNPLNDNIVEEFDDVGNTIAEYTTEPDQFGNVVSHNRIGEERYYHYDGLGSTVALTNAETTITDTYAYFAFGKVGERTGSTVNIFQFIGQKQYLKDADNSEWVVRRRLAPLEMYRWLTQDPSAVPTEPNYYSYANNRPTFTIDPSGLSIVSDCEWKLYRKRCKFIHLLIPNLEMEPIGAGSRNK